MNQNPNFHSFPYQPYRNEPNSQPLPTPPQQSPYQPYAYPQNPMPQAPRYPTFEENPVQPRLYPQDVPYHNRYPTLPQFQAPTEPHYPMDSPNSYPRIIIQQGVVYQPVPGVEHIVVPSPSQYNDQSLNNQSSVSYEQQIDRSMTHQDQNQLIQNYVAVPSREGQANYPESEIHRIETKIKSGFCCYTLLVWIGIIGAIVGVVTSLVVRGKFRGKLVAISLSVILLLGLIFALKAKKRMRSRKQFLVFIFFCLMTITHLVLSILGFVMYLRGARYHGSHGSHGYYGHSGHHGYYEEERGHCHGGRNVGMKIALGIFTILVPFVLHVILICCARTLVKLMKERELLLHNFRVQRI